MKRLTHFFRGTIRVTVEGVELEHFLGRCAKAGLLFWGVAWVQPMVLTMVLAAPGFRTMETVARACQCTMVVEERRGLPFFLARFRKRYALVAGLIFCMLTLAILSRFIFIIDVVGNEKVPTAAILSELRLRGVYPGVYGPSISGRELSHEILLSMDELSFFSLNRHGIRAEVIVREKLPEPEIVEEQQPTDVIATATGIITHIDVYRGERLCQEGETVVEGQVLISGLVNIVEPKYSQIDLGTYLVHADGQVFARTWHTLKASMPLTAQTKVYTGEEKTRFAFNILGQRLNFYRNGGISFDRYDKITKTRTWTLSDGHSLPFSLERETYRAYTTVETTLSQDAVEELLRKELQDTLLEQVEEGEVVRQDFVIRVKENALEATMISECLEEIGKRVPRVETVPNPAATLGQGQGT
ncbi:MAG: Stage sporulation protein [Firmicutes bacterium]|nr:Stage sporulation protein [Bacillota bacterium]